MFEEVLKIVDIIIKKNKKKNNQVISAENRRLLIPFEKIQAIQLSKSAQYIIVFSYLGNKIHIYYSDNGALKDCIFIGEHIFSIENIKIYPHKEDSFFFLANDKMLLFYLIDVEDLPCVCEPYKDEIILGRSFSFFVYIKSYFNKVFYFYIYINILYCLYVIYKYDIILVISLSFFGYIKSYFTKVFYFYNYFR